MPPGSRPLAQFSHPYAHDQVQGKVHCDDDNVGHTQLRPKGVRVTRGVVPRHPAAGAGSVSQRMGPKPGCVGLPVGGKLIIKQSGTEASLAPGVATCRKLLPSASPSPPSPPAPLGRAEKEGGGGVPPYTQKNERELNGSKANQELPERA